MHLSNRNKYRDEHVKLFKRNGLREFIACEGKGKLVNNKSIVCTQEQLADFFFYKIGLIRLRTNLYNISSKYFPVNIGKCCHHSCRVHDYRTHLTITSPITDVTTDRGARHAPHNKCKM